MRKIVIAVVVAALLALVVFLVRGSENEAVVERDGGPEAAASYANAERGLGFDYPRGYAVREELFETMKGHGFAVTLVRSEDTAIPEGGEGPRTVSVRFYPNPQGLGLLEWLRANGAESNFESGDGARFEPGVDGSATGTVAGKESVTYRWDGLYAGETTALLHKDEAMLVTIMYDGAEDPRWEAYRTILRTLRLR